MNLLEHYIKEIHSVKDVTKEYEERNGYTPNEPLLKVDLTYDCYGKVEISTYYFPKSKYEEAKEKGYFLA